MLRIAWEGFQKQGCMGGLKDALLACSAAGRRSIVLFGALVHSCSNLKYAAVLGRRVS